MAQPPLQWSCENSHLHSSRTGHTATVIPNRGGNKDHIVAIAFGDSSKQHYVTRSYFGSVLLYNVTTGASPEVVKAPMDVVSGRSHHTAVTLGNNILLVGGRGPNGDYLDSGPSSCCTLLQLERPRRWKVLRCPATELARRGHSMTEVDDVYYVFGGERRGVHLDDMWSFHPLTLSWETLKGHAGPDSPSARAFHGAASVDIEGRNYLGIFGGQSLEKPTNLSKFDGYTYDPRANEWQRHYLAKGDSSDSLTTFNGHFGHTFTPMGNNKYMIYGGWNSDDGSVDYRAMLLLLDARSNKFTIRPAPVQGSAPEPRAYHATTYSEDTGMVVFGGWKMSSQQASASVWKLDRVEKPKLAVDDGPGGKLNLLDLPGNGVTRRERRGSWAVDSSVRVVHQSPDRIVQSLGGVSPGGLGAAASAQAPDAAFSKLPVRMLSSRMLDLSVIQNQPAFADPKLTDGDVPEVNDVIKEMLISTTPLWKAPPKNRPFSIVNIDVLRRIVSNAEILLAQEETVVEIPPPARVYGDIHGQIEELQTMFRTYGSPNHVSGDVNLVNYVFLGDYVDRGDYSLEVVLLLFCLKIRYSSNIHLLRGNHEDRHINISYGFEKECVSRLGRRDGKEIWESINRVFDVMPIAALIGHRIFCVHGGLGKQLEVVDQLTDIQRPIKNPQEDELVRDVLWSDPTSHDSVVGLHANARGEGIWEFGPDKVDQFCKTNDVDLVIRAHQCVLAGYEYFARGHVVTIFSAASYCGHDNAGAMLEISPALRVHAKTIQSTKSNSNV